MNRSSTILSLQYLGAGIVLVFFVSILTLLFTFLGTITCSVLVGMMAGSMRRWRWQLILVSLVFPAVILAFAVFSKVDLAMGKCVLLALLCFGIFWIMYLVTFVLMAGEKRAQSLAGAQEGTNETPMGVSGATDGLRASSPSIAESQAESAVPGCEPVLEELQGSWTRGASSRDGQERKQVIEIVRNRIAWRVVDPAGRGRVILQGIVRPIQHGPVKMLEISVSEAGLPVSFTDDPYLPRTWVYRITDRTLTIGMDFEETAHGREPTSANYVRVAQSTEADRRD